MSKAKKILSKISIQEGLRWDNADPVLADFGQEDQDIVKKYFGDDADVVYAIEDDDERIGELKGGKPVGTGAEMTYFAITVDGQKALRTVGQGPKALFATKESSSKINALKQGSADDRQPEKTDDKKDDDKSV